MDKAEKRQMIGSAYKKQTITRLTRHLMEWVLESGYVLLQKEEFALSQKITLFLPAFYAVTKSDPALETAWNINLVYFR